MTPGLKALVIALVMALLAVPAAFAGGPGDHGHGKPAWAGGGQGHSHGKPPWAGQGHGKGHEKAKHDQKHQRAESEDQAAADGELNLEDLNPAWYCFTLETMMDEDDAEAADGGEASALSSFDAEFGTNENKANSHGMCVSRRAHGEDLSGALDDEEQQSCEPADEASGEEADSDEDASEPAASEDELESDDSGDSDEATSDENANEEAADAEQCENDDQAEQDDQDNEDDQAAEDDQGEDSDAQGDEDDQGDEAEAAAFARALVSFLRL